MVSLHFISPFFIVSNLQRAVSFYIDKLGFEIRYTAPGADPFFAIVGRNNVAIMLKVIAPSVLPLPNSTQHAWARWDAYINTSQPDELFKEFSSREVVFLHPVQDTADGLRGFELADADGYVLFFGRPLQ